MVPKASNTQPRPSNAYPNVWTPIRWIKRWCAWAATRSTGKVIAIDGKELCSALTGVAPIPASSGKTNRHRLSRGGDRQANNAIHRIVLLRMHWDRRAKEYVVKRSEEDMSKKEIMRCLKRYVYREVFRVMNNPRPVPLTTTSARCV